MDCRMSERLEGHEAEAGDEVADLLECVTACQDYIFTLTIRELRSHLDIEQVWRGGGGGK